MQDEKNKMIGNDMTEGNLLSVMIRFAIPLLLTNVIQQMYSAVDMMIVGNVVGSAGTVSVSSGSMLPNLIISVGGAFGNAAQVCAAQMCGAGNRKETGRMGCTILNGVLFLSLIVMVVSIAAAGSLLTLLNCPQEAYLSACKYMRTVSTGFPFILGYNVLSGVMRGMGESRRPLFFIIISAVTNVFLDILLVVVLPFGAFGSALATVAAQAATFFACLIYISRSGLSNVFDLKHNWRSIERKYLVPVTKIAIPLSLQYGSIQFSQMICNSWVNGFGLLAAATTSIGNKTAQVIGTIATSITGSAAAVVAQNLGAKKYQRVRNTVYAALAIDLVICVLEILVSLLLPEQLFSLFTNDPEVIAFGRTFLRINVITYILSAIQNPYTAVITGSGNSKLSLFYGILDGIVLRLGISYVLAFVAGMGVVGYWYGNALAHLGPVVIAVAYFYSNRWIRRRLVSDELKKGEDS